MNISFYGIPNIRSGAIFPIKPSYKSIKIYLLFIILLLIILSNILFSQDDYQWTQELLRLYEMSRPNSPNYTYVTSSEFEAVINRGISGIRHKSELYKICRIVREYKLYKSLDKIRSFLETLMQDGDWDNHYEIIDTMSSLGDYRVVEDIIKMFDNINDGSQYLGSYFHIIGRYASAEHIKYLLKHKKNYVRKEAINLVRDREINGLLNIVESELDGDDPEKLISATDCLASMGHREAIPKLIMLCKRMKDTKNNDNQSSLRVLYSAMASRLELNDVTALNEYMQYIDKWNDIGMKPVPLWKINGIRNHKIYRKMMSQRIWPTSEGTYKASLKDILLNITKNTGMGIIEHDVDRLDSEIILEMPPYGMLGREMMGIITRGVKDDDTLEFIITSDGIIICKWKEALNIWEKTIREMK